MLKKVLLTGLIAISASVHASEIETEDADTSPPLHGKAKLNLAISRVKEMMTQNLSMVA